MEIQCPNPDCRTENPENARFCRKCGTAFNSTNRFKTLARPSILQRFIPNSPGTDSSVFTLDTFRNINFHPVSIVNINFINRFTAFLFVLFSALWIAISTGLAGVVIKKIDRWFYSETYIYHNDTFESVCLVVAGLCALIIAKNLINKIRYKLNADFIEDKFLKDGIVRIARKSQMGLFDKNKKKVLLSSSYSNIEKFDDHHLLVCNGNKKGLYSLTYCKMIVPVLYDSISQFANSVTSATIQGTERHYDVKGNELR